MKLMWIIKCHLLYLHPEMRNRWVREERMTLHGKDGRVTGRGIGGTQVVICRLNIIKK